MAHVFITGGTGYIGRPVIAALLARGHSVRALVRSSSLGRVPAGAEPVIGDALSGDSYADAVRTGDVFIHLVGTPHPGPSKSREFEQVDWVSAQQAIRVASTRGVSHFVYLSVAQPAPVMRAYQAVRARGEALLATSGLPFTAVRPWYVVGPGHRWPLLLVPFYAIWERLASTRPTALRLGLVTLGQMVAALVYASEHAPSVSRVVEVPEIRAMEAD
ncbi:MAG: NAD(P)H-binding protein [Cytophagaceae bacterium]|nr:NAD(P)H-binding protein [Gemmatimonadaceae bacterium]